MPSDCPIPDEACRVASCENNGTCSTDAAPAGTLCPGGTCDANGTCRTGGQGGSSTSGTGGSSPGGSGPGGSTGVGGAETVLAVAITGKDRFSCAFMSDGTARCWGRDFEGSLGIGTTGGTHPLPVEVAGLADVPYRLVSRTRAVSPKEVAHLVGGTTSTVNSAHWGQIRIPHGK